ncbi:Short-chain dehydrogenase/reductase 2b [Spatholobus suberectus]|nr:Short-chain dehydrogenase/reductase 2b [Spatholobus suberectus]
MGQTIKVRYVFLHIRWLVHAFVSTRCHWEKKVQWSCEKISERGEVKEKLLDWSSRGRGENQKSKEGRFNSNIASTNWCTSQFRLETEDGRSYRKINNAGIGGIVFEDLDVMATVLKNRGAVPEDDRTKAIIQTYELAEECVQINYYGAKITVESLIPLLQLSDSPRIVNVSATLGQLEVADWSELLLLLT